MDLEGRKNNVYFDKTGKQILEGDLLQVFHFRTGNKIYYMYHVAVMEETKDFPVMALQTYYSIKPHYRLYQVCDNEQRVYHAAKIVCEKDYQTKRQKIKII
ncbi:hypothetical protein [Chryseobacterium taichungense]|uniref:hypothetical protein n=1 Tax=Chryseobacterium taichungense TaxID=295069 RepID=UPI0028A9F848|nr:hypothetical protein [Chryseobacterium taichungense]